VLVCAVDRTLLAVNAQYWQNCCTFCTEYDDSGRDDDGNVIPETTNGNVAAAATNGTVSGKHRREIKKV